MRSDVDHASENFGRLVSCVLLFCFGLFAKGFPARQRARDFPGARGLVAAAELIISTFMLYAHTYAAGSAGADCVLFFFRPMLVYCKHTRWIRGAGGKEK